MCQFLFSKIFKSLAPLLNFISFSLLLQEKVPEGRMRQERDKRVRYGKTI
jgi:hypothetical protein